MRKWDIFLRFTSFDARWKWWPTFCPMPEDDGWAVDILWGRYCLTLGWQGAYQP